ncbi:hypothetical protein QCA50_002184 [Cerrena zonata]|uniref:DNA replication regulator SLD2 n=1 Tax=Cerrena zonata TaxID=2478898 RepID=A0AAW0GYN8_9APHY
MASLYRFTQTTWHPLAHFPTHGHLLPGLPFPIQESGLSPGTPHRHHRPPAFSALPTWRTQQRVNNPCHCPRSLITPPARSSALMDNDLLSLRADIKAWERQFKAKHARQPTVDEIRQQPAMAEKYRLYKKLAKSSASSSQLPQNPPSTPPKSQPRPTPSSLLHKSRAVKTETVLTTSNPFSPVKSKQRRRDLSPEPSTSILPALSLSARANPFTTPRKNKKNKLKPHATTSPRELSPDPFPLIQPFPALSATMNSMTAMHPPPVPVLSTSIHSHSQASLIDLNPSTPGGPSRAIDRARKRLRGELVSPSPVKEKRARTAASQSTLNFIQGANTHKRASQLLFDEEQDNEDSSDLSDGGKRKHDRDDRADMDDIIIEATPMKPPKGGKAFVALFQDIIPSDQDVIVSAISGRSRPSHSIPPILGRSQSALARLSTGSDKTSTKSKTRRSLSRVSPVSDEDEEEELGLGNGDRDEDDDSWRSGPTTSSGSSPSSGPTTKLKALNLSSSTNVLDRTRSQASIPSIKKRAQTQSSLLPFPVLPGKDDLKSSGGPSFASSVSAAHSFKSNHSSSAESGQRRGAKRASSDIEMDEMGEEPENEGAFDDDGDDVASGSGSGTKSKRSNTTSSRAQGRTTSTHGGGSSSTRTTTIQANGKSGKNQKGKGKAKAIPSASAISRKKAKILKELGGSDEDGDEESAEDGLDSGGENNGNVKVLEWSWQSRRRRRQQSQYAAQLDQDDDYDPTTQPHYAHHSDLHSHTDHAHSHSTAFIPTSSEGVEGSCEVDLPSDLARVLAISPSHTSSYLRDRTEQKVVKELLYGSRERHYDPQRGGIVYDVGEEDQSEGVDGGEDDWEGEPVPWEAGEL